MAHEIDYKIFGDDMQMVEIELDPREGVRAEAGMMMYMEDGRYQRRDEQKGIAGIGGGILGGILSGDRD